MMNSEWILTDVTLPPKTGMYLVTYIWIEYVYDGTTGKLIKEKTHLGVQTRKWSQFSGWGDVRYTDGAVIAWMDLPAPYVPEA